MGTDIHLAVEVRSGLNLRDLLGEDAPSTALINYKPWVMLGHDGFDSKGHGGIFPQWPGRDSSQEERDAYWSSDPGGRNYDLFAFLADVRNGTGFAGTYRHEPIRPQFPGRGLPVDLDAGCYANIEELLVDGVAAPTNDEERETLRFLRSNLGDIMEAARRARDPRSKRVLLAIQRLKAGATTEGERVAAEKAEARWKARWFSEEDLQQDSEDEDDKFWPGYHDFTWATYAELKAAPWDTPFNGKGGYVPVVSEGSESWCSSVLPADYTPEDNWSPEAWSGGISGPGIRMMEYSEWVECGAPRVPQLYVRIYWTCRPLLDCAFKRWLDTTVAKIAAEYGDENVRVVMGFDS